MNLKHGNKEYKLLFKGIIGSQAYGTSTPQSDIDYKGVFVLSNDDILVGDYVPFIEVNKDEVYYELGRFMELLNNGNPTVMELLFLPENCIVFKDSLFDEFIKNRESFLTKECLKAISGYAKSQIKKATGLNKKMNWEKSKIERKGPLHFCYVYQEKESSIPLYDFLEMLGIDQSEIGLGSVNYFPNTYSIYHNPEVYRGMIKDENEGSGLRTSSILKTDKCIGILHYNESAFQIHCKEYLSYKKWQKTANYERYVDVGEHGQKIDGKNMMHCRRLIDMCKEIINGKGLNVYRENAAELLDIRKGKVNLQDLIEGYEKDLDELIQKNKTCNLPDIVDSELRKNIILKIRNSL